MGQVDNHTVGDTVLIVRSMTAAANGYVPVTGTVPGRVKSNDRSGDFGSSTWDDEAVWGSLRIFGPRAFDEG